MKKLIPILFIATFALAGCSTTMVPVGANREAVGPNRVDIFVGQNFPRFYRRDPYTPIHVTIRNNTSHKVNLSYRQFLLIDPRGHEFVIAPVRDVFSWVRYERWAYYRPYYPSPARNYVFREGNLAPGREVQAIMFFNQATRLGQGTYRLLANIPENGKTLEFNFRLD